MSGVRSITTRGGFLELKQGAYASLRGRACKIRRVISLDNVVIQYVEGGETDRVHPMDLKPVEDAVVEAPPQPQAGTEGEPPGSPDEKAGLQDINEINDTDWEDAKKCLKIIEPLLNNPKRTRAEATELANKAGVQTSTIYRWMSEYTRTGHLSALIKAKRGRKPGTRRLSPEQEAIIAVEIEKFLDPQSITPATLIENVATACDEQSVPCPHPNTIRNRAVGVPLKRRMSARGQSEAAAHRFDATPGSFPDGNFPLECVQIDHVRLDIKVVDAETRQPIEKRPWLTLVIDCFSRMIIGYFLSLAAPSAFGTGVALYMGMMPKRDLLGRLNLPGNWPVFGKVRKILADNAKEFKGELLQRGCDEHGIDLQLRPVKTPRYGAYIESMVGNVNRQLHKKLGTTHRSPDESPDYDSSQKAVYTLAALEAEIVDWIVNKYHVDGHSSLKTTPLRKWEQGLLGDSKNPGVGLPPMPIDPEKLRLDFLPFQRRAIHPYGVEMDRLYYHEVLRTWVGAADPENPTKKRKFIFHYDPRSIRRIWFWDPDVKRHFEIPIRDTTWPDISWSEYDEYNRAVKKEGAAHVDEAAIKGYVQRSRIREQQEKEQTQAARARAKPRSADKNAPKHPANAAPGSSLYATVPGTVKLDTVKEDNGSATADDLFDTPARAFDDIDI